MSSSLPKSTNNGGCRMIAFIWILTLLLTSLKCDIVKAEGRNEEEAAVLFAAHIDLKEQLDVLQKVSCVTMY